MVIQLNTHTIRYYCSLVLYLYCTLLLLQDGYRYVLAERDPHSSIIVDVDDLAGRPIPPELYRPLVSPDVLLTLHDRGSKFPNHHIICLSSSSVESV